MIIFSKHALVRARERSIAENEIIDTVEEPVEVVDAKYGSKASFKHFDCDYLVATYETRNGEIVVVTSVKVDKKRLARYGFRRI